MGRTLKIGPHFSKKSVALTRVYMVLSRGILSQNVPQVFVFLYITLTFFSDNVLLRFSKIKLLSPLRYLGKRTFTSTHWILIILFLTDCWMSKECNKGIRL